ncbi:glycosyltransferase [Rhodococcus pyridinivorans]|uniref:glycosyltransferase family protein n=1 Tax=Rhodococcus pyridinivorans TaxID=103816 RepID=UPI002225BB3A|nr:glycosyltransferase [Rhodococcus pyridinivorans]MCW3468056.1 glycosyltransferase [Rhodococcus pyridinivorans]
MVLPLGYANDEPLKELMETFRRLPNVNFALTGNAPSWMRKESPPNVKFTGYISNEDYWGLVQDCDGVVALTNRDFTMQRAGYEALICGVPHVTSTFDVLREFYEDAAVYSNLDPESIVNAISYLLENSAALRESARSVLARRRDEQLRTLEQLRGEDGTSVGSSETLGGRGA